MNRISALALALLFPTSASLYAAQEPTRDEETSKTIAQLQERIPQLMQQTDVPGLSVALIRQGRLAWSGAFGLADTAQGRSVDQDTVFEAASLSKPVFAYGVMTLVEEGKIDLDAPLTRYLADYIASDPRLEEITARRVLNHTTGLPNWRPRGRDLRILLQPGSRFSYSGEGFVYLQKVIEKITGKALNDFMQEAVFDPLGMRDSSYVWQERFKTRAADAYAPDGRKRPIRKGRPANAASSLLTTPRDYARFVSAVLLGQGLQPKTFEETFAPQSRVEEGCVQCARRPASRRSDSLAWGLGWGLQTQSGDRSIWHWGDNGSFKCFVLASLDRKSGLMVMTNSSNGLALSGALAEFAVNGPQPWVAWIDYEPHDGPAFTFHRVRREKGYREALKSLSQLQGAPQFREKWLGRLGQRLLRANEPEQAVGVLQLNADAFPQSSKAWEALGEALAKKGDRQKALESYRKSIELDPSNSKAADALKRLESEQP